MRDLGLLYDASGDFADEGGMFELRLACDDDTVTLRVPVTEARSLLRAIEPLIDAVLEMEAAHESRRLLRLDDEGEDTRDRENTVRFAAKAGLEPPELDPQARAFMPMLDVVLPPLGGAA